MKSIMKSFNMENVVLPLSYKANTITLNEDGFGLTSYHLYNMIKLEIGKKYYTFYEKAIMAFKVLRIVVFKTKGLHYSICYEVKLANGYVLRIDVFKNVYGVKNAKETETNRLYKVFSSKEDIFEYRQTKDESLIHSEKWSLDDIINQYIPNEFEINQKSTLDTIDYLRDIKVRRYYNNFNLRGYYLDDNSSLMSCSARFKYFWIDELGAHYQAYDMVNDKKLYPTKQEALASLQVFDFDDEEDESEENEEITINLNVKVNKDVYNEIQKLLSK